MKNGLLRWNPFEELEALQGQVGALFGGVPVRKTTTGEVGDLNSRTWSPRVDILETETEFQIKADLPEVKKENVQVTVEKGVLSIRGERKMESKVDNKETRYHRVERAYGVFTRSFMLPEGADPESVKAEFKDGVLLLRLPKQEKARPRSVQVEVA